MYRLTLAQVVCCLAVSGLIASASTALGAESAKRPNILLIMADDVGYSDLGCYGSEIETPNLDRLAASGVRFTQFYNTARCCPTRAALLTGLYPHQAGIGHMMEDRKLDGYRGNLNRNCVTIAEALRLSGYRTYMVGKWHVTRHLKPDADKSNWPLQRGFDHFYGTIAGGGSYYDPSTLTRDNTTISAFADDQYKPSVYYYTDALAEHAVRFLSKKEDQADKPFFMYLAFTAAHWPMHALEEDIAKYKGKYDAGYGPIRDARLAKMKKLGLVDDRWKPAPMVGNWAAVADKEREIRCMETYAAMIDRMDRGIGRVIDQLKSTGQLDNTLILFLQDNGACAEPMGRTSPKPAMARADSPSLPPLAPTAFQIAGGMPKQTRDGYPVRQGRGVMPGPADTYIAYGEGWANVSNTPFREYKHWVHEGGISTPLVVNWPAGISRKGDLEATPAHLVDLMATFIDVSGANYPRRHADHDIPPLAGVSLAPAFAGKTIDREAIYWEHEGNRAIRVKNEKLVAKGPRGDWELYDLATDRGEQTNLAADQPARVKELAAKWEAWAKRSQVIPWIWGAPYAAAAVENQGSEKK